VEGDFPLLLGREGLVRNQGEEELGESRHAAMIGSGVSEASRRGRSVRCPERHGRPGCRARRKTSRTPQ
jgi:hypothetical protein